MELKFRFEVRKQVPASLQLYNPTDAPVAFKVKTTSPKKYCVRPNTSVIPPGQTQEVMVIMQAQKEMPPDLNACKDKFLVQCVQVTAETSSPEKAAEMLASKSAGVHECKLKVTFLVPHAPPSPVPEDDAGEMAAAQVPSASDASKLRNALESLSAATGEKEMANTQVERLQRELASLATKRETLELANNLANARAGSKVPGKGGVATAPAKKEGYNLIHLLIIFLIFFLLGRYVPGV